jgi:hypothetical protein
MDAGLTLNHNEAARLAAIYGTPYVPWNVAETFEPQFESRIPHLPDGKDPRGWDWIGALLVRESRPAPATVRLALKDYNFFPTIGVAWAGDGLLSFFVPNEKAHELRKADR